MFPLKQRILIRGAAAHVKAGLGVAADYVAVYVPFYIPFDGVATHTTGQQGGLQFKLTRPNGDRIEFFHLKSIALPDGKVTAGQIGGVTGNSGLLKPGAPPYVPHSHIQIFNKAGKRLDPETYNWEEGKHMIQLIRDKGTVYLVAGVNKKVKTGIASQEVLSTLFGDEPIVDGDTSSIPHSFTASTGLIVHKV